MSAVVSDCCTPCPTVPPVNVPGSQGAAGANGTNGVNAFTTTTANFTVPALNSTVNVAVVNSAGFFIGMAVSVNNGTSTADTYAVTLVPDSTHITLKYLNYSTNTNAGNTTNSGAIVGPSGFQPISFTPLNPANNLSDVSNALTSLNNLGAGNAAQTNYQVGGSQALTTSLTSTLLSCTVTLSTTGHYQLYGHVRYDLVAGTITANTTTVTGKLRRTNNTPADITGAVSNLLIPAVGSSATQSVAVMDTPMAFYSGTAGDVIAVVGGFTGALGSGAINVIEAAIFAIRLY